MLGRRLIALAVAGLASIGIGSRPVPTMVPTIRQTAPRERRSSKSAGVSAWGYQNGPGWTCAHVKRMAKKRRNQARNKQAHRARKGGA